MFRSVPKIGCRVIIRADLQFQLIAELWSLSLVLMIRIGAGSLLAPCIWGLEKGSLRYTT